MQFFPKDAGPSKMLTRCSCHWPPDPQQRSRVGITAGSQILLWKSFSLSKAYISLQTYLHRTLLTITLHVSHTNVQKTYRPSTATSMWLPVKWRYFRVTSGHFRSRDVIFWHLTAISSMLQPCRSSNVPKTWLIANYSRFQVTSGEMKSLPDHFRSSHVISCHVTATSCELQPCRCSNVPNTWLIGLPQPLPGAFRSNDVTSGHFRSPDAISIQMTATSCTATS